MAPTLGNPSKPKEYVEQLISQNAVMIFSKSTCPYCVKVKELFRMKNQHFNVLELDQIEGGADVQAALVEKTQQKTVPNVFVHGCHIGGCDAILSADAGGTLNSLLKGVFYDYDLAVIGGGSGGLAAAKEAAKLGRRVIVLDFVTPTPKGTKWGLGGTCVNVGCIPKKLMHKAALLGEDMKDALSFGWSYETATHDWRTMVENITNYIKKLNFGYRSQLVSKKVTYKNAYAEFIDHNKLKCTSKAGVQEITARQFIVAVGGRPNYPDIPGAKKYGITSDDLFFMQRSPGTTLLVGASYIALECAGFLAGLGFDCTVMVRSVLLRGFDQQMAEMIGEHMKEHNIKFINSVPTKVEEISPGDENNLPRLRVTASSSSGEEFVGEFNTVIFAVGRKASTETLGLDVVKVATNPNNKKIVVNEKEETTAPHVFAIGDVIDGKPELTPVAIQAGRLLARRLYGGSNQLTDYVNIPTTVFTPLEYGCVGLSEEDAIAKYGEDGIEVYHTHFQPLEYELSGRDANMSYGKLICVKNENERVVGFHVLSPNAGEITQGYAIGLKMGATKEHFSNLIGIHPTCAEWFTVMDVSKASGGDVKSASC